MTITLFYISLVIKEHDLAIEIAVSNMSPVSIQTLIPAYYNFKIVSGTPSYNLSSTMEAPEGN